MDFTVSSLGFTCLTGKNMALLTENFGIEVFYGWASEQYWLELLERCFQGERRGFSIHSPFDFYSMDSEIPDEKLFDYLSAPFDLYHRFHGSHYVVHTDSGGCREVGRYEKDWLRGRCIDRINRFSEICRKNGIGLVIENVPCPGGNGLFDQERFTGLFRQNPELRALYDTGHGNMSGYDVRKLQSDLKEQLAGYHIHDNFGAADSHLRIGKGNIDWRAFMEGVRRDTPNASMVLEYNEASLEDYENDRESLENFGEEETIWKSVR